jgi:hypothetical protein
MKLSNYFLLGQTSGQSTLCKPDDLPRLFALCLSKQTPAVFQTDSKSARSAAQEFIHLFVSAQIAKEQFVSVRIYSQDYDGSQRVSKVIKRPWWCFLRDFVTGSSFRQQLFDFPLDTDFLRKESAVSNAPIMVEDLAECNHSNPFAPTVAHEITATTLLAGAMNAAGPTFSSNAYVEMAASDDVVTLQKLIPELFDKFVSTLPFFQFAFGERNCAAFLPSIAKPVLFQSYASTGLSFTSLHVDHGGAAMNQVVWAGGGNDKSPNDTRTDDTCPSCMVPEENFVYADDDAIVAVWTFFAAQNLEQVEKYLNQLPRSDGSTLSVFANNYFLTEHDLAVLAAAPWLVPHMKVNQRLGDTVLVPVNCAHQVQNLCNNYKIAVHLFLLCFLFSMPLFYTD